MAKRRKKPSLPPIMAKEREQISIRRSRGMLLAIDEHGRERVPTNTAEGKRQYERAKGGTVRLRLADPLEDIKALTDRQKAAGLRYRDSYEAVAGHGIKPPSVDLRVDRSGTPTGLPDHILDAYQIVRKAVQVVGHHEIAMVVEHVCGLRLSIREIAERTGDPRAALSKLLVIGLDKLADTYFGAQRFENRIRTSKIT